MSRSSRCRIAVAVVCSALAQTPRPAQAAEVPIPVSPGESQQAVALSGRCPTFSWGAVGGARAYELVVYAIGSDEVESRPVLRKRIPGSALSWTPALADCLRSPGRYAWVIRALKKASESSWSSPRLFEIAARPSAEELEAALEIVRRHIEAEGGDSTGVTPDGEVAVKDGGAEPRQPETLLPGAPGGSDLVVEGNVEAQSFSGQLFAGQSFSGQLFRGTGSNTDAVIEGSNEGSGPGVSGDAEAGPGLFGESVTGYGALGESTSGIGVYGKNLTSGNFGYLGSDTYGVLGASSSGDGVSGSSQTGVGVVGASQSDTGVRGLNLDTGNLGVLGAAGGGVYGESPGNYGVEGKHVTSGNWGRLGTDSFGVYGESPSGAGVEGKHTASGNWGRLGTDLFGVYGETVSGAGVEGKNTSSGAWGRLGTGSHGVYGQKGSTWGGLGEGLYGAYGASESGTGVHGESSTGVAVEGLHQTSGNTGQFAAATYGAQGKHAATGNFGQLGASQYGVYGEAPVAGSDQYGAYGKHVPSGNYGFHGSSTYGVYGYSQGGTGAAGASETGVGVTGSSNTGTAVEGHHTLSGNYGELGKADHGVHGLHFTSGNTGSLGTGNSGVRGTGSPYAGYFVGNLHVTGTLSKGGGTFVQPHREDPSREIQYAFFEGPEHAVFFRGTSRLEKGRATLELPEHFRVVAAEEGVQVQATAIDECNGLYVAGQSREQIEIRELMGGRSDARFNYLVTAVRAGFEGHEPIVANTHFKPDKGESIEEFEARFSGDDSVTRALRSMLIANGLLTKDGELDMAMVRKLDWEVVGESRLSAGPTSHRE